MLRELLISARTGTAALGFGAAFGVVGQSTISPDRGRGLDLDACSILTDRVRCGAGMRAAT